MSCGRSEVSCASRGSGLQRHPRLLLCAALSPHLLVGRQGRVVLLSGPIVQPGLCVHLAPEFWLCPSSGSPCSAFSPGFTVTISEGLQAARRLPMGSCLLPPGTCLPLALFYLMRARTPSGPRCCPELPHTGSWLTSQDALCMMLCDRDRPSRWCSFFKSIVD